MKLVCFALAIAAALLTDARAATVSDLNIFNDGTTQATANSTTTYGGFSVNSIDDRNGDTQFFFADAFTGSPEILSLSGFNATAGISTLRFYGQQEFEIRRVPLTVTIYTSAFTLTGTASLTESNYTLLGTYALPATLDVPNNHAYYTTGTDSTGGDGNYGKYDDLTNLGIAAGTKSILFDFGVETQGGRGLSEIEGFAAVPEPSTYALMGVGALALIVLARRQVVTR